MRLIAGRVLSSLTVGVLSTSLVYSQELPKIVVNPKVPPPFPETTISNLPAPEWVALGNDVPGVVEPVLVPRTIQETSGGCKGLKESGVVVLSFVIDSSGQPRNVMFKEALGTQVDLLALQLLLTSRFKPAMANGAPIAFGRDVSMKLDVCTERIAGEAKVSTRLSGALKEQFQNWRNAQTRANLAPLHMPPDTIADAEKVGVDGFSLGKAITRREYDSRGMSGKFNFGVLVDEHGVSHVQRVLQSTNPSLLPIAVEMIQSVRHTPALKDGMPVPVHFSEGLEIKSGMN